MTVRKLHESLSKIIDAEYGNLEVRLWDQEDREWCSVTEAEPIAGKIRPADSQDSMFYAIT